VFDSDTITQDVRITVRSRYVAERSRPELGHYLFIYTVRITNTGAAPVKLVSRKWHIEDATGRSEEIEGPGVVGKQPRLTPGQAFEYTSFCPLPSPTGFMEGTYQMVFDDGRGFDAVVGRFELSEPLAYN
jgi:ApaG protein